MLNHVHFSVSHTKEYHFRYKGDCNPTDPFPAWDPQSGITPGMVNIWQMICTQGKSIGHRLVFVYFIHVNIVRICMNAEANIYTFS